MRQSMRAPDVAVIRSAAEVGVWTCRTLARSGDVERCRALLPDDEVARTDRFRSPRTRAQALVAAGLVRSVLAHETGSDPKELRFTSACRWCGHPTHGKPALVSPDVGPLSFSLAHTEGLALLAVAATEVGVDVERPPAWDVGPARRLTLSHAEQRDLASVPPPARVAAFLRLWTLKEAYLKGIGRGIVHDPALVTFAPTGSEWSTVLDGGTGTSWNVRSLDLGEPVGAALAVDGAPRTVLREDWTP
jgi:4'-phosphopantetheinyl transferase